MKTSNEWTWFERLERACWWGAGIFIGAWRSEHYANDIPPLAKAVMGFLLFLTLTWSQERIHRLLGRVPFFRGTK